MNTQLKILQEWFGKNTSVAQGASAPLLVVAILAMMVLPLPPLLLDAFFTINIAVALMVLLTHQKNISRLLKGNESKVPILKGRDRRRQRRRDARQQND